MSCGVAPCGFGGRRPLFFALAIPRAPLWPASGNALHRGKYFLCRHCSDLTYTRSNKARESSAQQGAKDRARFGSNANMFEDFPPSPTDARRTLATQKTVTGCVSASLGMIGRMWPDASEDTRA